jgi:hypothetical protein
MSAIASADAGDARDDALGAKATDHRARAGIRPAPGYNSAQVRLGGAYRAYVPEDRGATRSFSPPRSVSAGGPRAQHA